MAGGIKIPKRRTQNLVIKLEVGRDKKTPATVKMQNKIQGERNCEGWEKSLNQKRSIFFDSFGFCSVDFFIRSF